MCPSYRKVRWPLANDKNMKTLHELIVAAKCRKGPSVGTNKHGAFWLACEPILIRSFGGDGIGQSAPDKTNRLQLRHYRDGTTKAVVNFHQWHQNYGTSDSYRTVQILDCTTVEDVIVILKSVSHDETAAYADWGKDNLTKALTDLGMIEAAPGPDEEE